MSISFSFITARLATGGAISPTEEDAQTLVQVGITHIIVCNAGEDDATLFKRYFPQEKVLENGTEDDGQSKPVSWFKTSLDFALPALSLPKFKVYAHCEKGFRRGPSTAYAILRAQGLTHDEAIAMIVLKRPMTAAPGGIAYRDDADTAIIALGYD